MGEPSGASVRGGLSLFCWMEPRRVRAVRGPMASGSIVRHVVDRPLLKAARSLQTRSARPYAGIPRGPGPVSWGGVAVQSRTRSTPEGPWACDPQVWDVANTGRH